MFWMLAGLALNFASQSSQAAGSLGQVKIQSWLNDQNTDSTNIVNTANTYATNEIRGASNAFQAAQVSLQNTQRSIQNQEKMAAYGSQYNAIQTNQVRVMDNMLRGNLSTQLKGAAALGALRADAAARGVGGSSADIMRSVAALQMGAINTQAEDNKKYVQYDQLLQRQGLIRTAVNSMDYGQSLPNMDYGINVAPLAQSPILAGLYAPSPTMQGITSMFGNTNAAQLGQIASSVANAWKGWSTPSPTVAPTMSGMSSTDYMATGFDSLSGNYGQLGSGYFTGT